MTPEQIKVLEAMRVDLAREFAQCPDEIPEQQTLSFQRHDALTAALEFIEDMREIEAEAVTVYGMDWGMTRLSRPGWEAWRHEWENGKIEDIATFREAFKAVKGGKD